MAEYEWVKLTQDIKTHPLHKDFIEIKLKSGQIINGDYMYDKFYVDDDPDTETEVAENDIEAWRIRDYVED